MPTAEDTVAQITSELIRIDTSNRGDNEGPGEREAAEYCATKLSEAGLDPQLLESDQGRANVVAHWEGADPSLPPLLIHGHTDVVPATAADWSVDPFAGEIKDGCVWGRGAVDMKDFDAMLLAVVAQRQAENRPPKRPVRIVFTADEEAGGKYGSEWLVNEHPDLIKDCTEAIGEVGGFSLTVGDKRLYLVETAEKGMQWLKLVTDGTAGHGSMRNPDNAVTTMARAIANIGEYQWPTRMHPAQRAFLDAVGEAMGTEITPENAEQLLERLGSIARMVGATMSNSCNPTMLEAGYKVNVIPGSASAHVDGRTIPGYTEEFLDTLTRLIGDKVRIEPIAQIDGIETPFEGRVVDAIHRAIAAEDPGAMAVPYLCSAGTDGKLFNRLGVRTFGFTPLRLPPELDFTGMFHGIDERVPVDALQFGCRVLDRLLDEA